MLRGYHNTVYSAYLAPGPTSLLSREINLCKVSYIVCMSTATSRPRHSVIFIPALELKSSCKHVTSFQVLSYGTDENTKTPDHGSVGVDVELEISSNELSVDKTVSTCKYKFISIPTREALIRPFPTSALFQCPIEACQWGCVRQVCFRKEFLRTYGQRMVCIIMYRMVCDVIWLGHVTVDVCLQPRDLFGNVNNTLSSG
mmetsp:Transcript_28205/g.45347  ORF Transcript_28205/g.45347 Transcript_28205/m.45347 type:complete len:200 (+) Transcript_28205:326-925(+)